jgi:hypothetical protein
LPPWAQSHFYDSVSLSDCARRRRHLACLSQRPLRATIDYPDFFKAQPPPDNDDGRKFKSADGADFTVSAVYALDFDLAKYRDFILENLDPCAVVTYQAHGGDWFVISGTKGAAIFYERHLLSHGGEMTENFVMSYPASLKETYAPIIARMAKSFRPGAGFQTP